MRLLRFTTAAEIDIEEAFDWYRTHATPGVSQRLVAELRAATERITENPVQFPTVHKDCRRALLRRFPYALFFRVREDDIQVLACFHVRRDPRGWRARV